MSMISCETTLLARERQKKTKGRIPKVAASREKGEKGSEKELAKLLITLFILSFRRFNNHPKTAAQL